jgi:hypothetical protein
VNDGFQICPTSALCGLQLFYDAIPNVNIRAAYFARPAALRKINIGCCMSTNAAD